MSVLTTNGDHEMVYKTQLPYKANKNTLKTPLQNLKMFSRPTVKNKTRITLKATVESATKNTLGVLPHY